MAQSKENQQPLSKTKNRKVYIARQANSVDQCDECETEYPRRDSVTQIKSVYENLSATNSPGRSFQVGSGNAKSSSQEQFEAAKSFENAHELKLTEDQTLLKIGNSRNFLPTQKKELSNHNTVPDGIPNQMEAKFAANSNTVDPKVSDSFDLSAGEGHGLKSIRPGTLLLQPASNVRGPLAKAEYLKLNKFNDIRVHFGSKKRAKVNVDELDKKIDDYLPLPCGDDALEDNIFDDPAEEPQTNSDSDFAVEFEGAGIKTKKPALKTGKSHEKKVSFSHQPADIFEYPSEETRLDSDSQEPSSESDHQAAPEKVTSKALQTNPVCNGTGQLGLYQPRLLEQCSVMPFSTTDKLSNRTVAQPKGINSQPKEIFLGKNGAVGSCSAEEYSWSGGNSGTELLF